MYHTLIRAQVGDPWLVAKVYQKLIITQVGDQRLAAQVYPTLIIHRLATCGWLRTCTSS